jgi:hypothetical protein
MNQVVPCSVKEAYNSREDPLYKQANISDMQAISKVASIASQD